MCVACCVWGRSSDVVMVISSYLCFGSVGLIGHTCYVTNYDSYHAVACGPGTPLRPAGLEIGSAYSDVEFNGGSDSAVYFNQIPTIGEVTAGQSPNQS